MDSELPKSFYTNRMANFGLPGPINALEPRRNDEKSIKNVENLGRGAVSAGAGRDCRSFLA